MTRGRPLDSPRLYRAALDGEQPAEVLSPYDRRVLMATLIARGLTDVEIAVRTKWTTYTVGRIREHCGLDPNHSQQERNSWS